MIDAKEARAITNSRSADFWRETVEEKILSSAQQGRNYCTFPYIPVSLISELERLGYSVKTLQSKYKFTSDVIFTIHW